MRRFSPLQIEFGVLLVLTVAGLGWWLCALVIG